MCGIVGIISLKNEKVDLNVLKNMQSAIKHRGPDGQGLYVNKNKDIAFAMNRLSIIDLSGGDQPLFNEDKTIAIVGNGEIYNYLELQSDLRSKGHKFRTGSDIETIIHAYEEWGLKCFNKFRGMFAISMHDQKNNKMILARDRMGEKPLYYTNIEDSIFFGSELKTLHNLPNLDKTIDNEAIDLYFHYYFIPEPYTAFKNIKKIPSGSIMEIDLNKSNMKINKYWDANDINPTYTKNPTKRIKSEFSKSCELTLRSDVPVGIALSGGIDSGSILANSASKYKETMKAFSIGYEGSNNSDERKDAKELAKKFKVEFFEKEIKTKDIVKNFPKLIYACDDPIADIAAHSIYEVNLLARKNGIKVILGGNGGDEIFWGYPSTTERLKEILRPNTLWKKIFKNKISFFNNPDPEKTIFAIKQLYSKEFNKSVGKKNYLKVLKVDNFNKRKIVKNTLTNLRDVWLKSDVITLGDRMSMAASVEMRSPFLDYKLIESALSSTKNIDSFSMGNKYYLKKAMENTLPEEVLNRPKKGFTPPVAKWIDGLLKRYAYLLKDGFLVKEKIIDVNKMKLINTIISQIPTYTAYQMLVLEMWGRIFVYNEKIK